MVMSINARFSFKKRFNLLLKKFVKGSLYTSQSRCEKKSLITRPVVKVSAASGAFGSDNDPDAISMMIVQKPTNVIPVIAMRT